MKDKTIFIKNIYYMLSYAFTNLEKKNYEDIASEKFDNIHDLLASILSKGISQQLKQGLYREYVNVSENLPVMRGKINITGSISNKIQQKQLLACEYDELTENNILNQILKTSAYMLIRHSDVRKNTKNDLKKEMLFFSNIDIISPEAIMWSRIHINRISKNYEMLINICRFILDGMLLTDEKGNYRMLSFLDQKSMERLYEKFILEYYKKNHRKVSASASHIKWALDEGSESALLPTMKSDITLSCGSKILIIDAKYYSHSLQYNYETPSIHSGNLYQIFTYVKNKQSEFKNHKVAGMLLYAKTDEETEINSSYSMSGNKISVKTLDLNCDFEIIKAQLDKIAKDYFEE